jgi:cytochrome c biogenesis factor
MKASSCDDFIPAGEEKIGDQRRGHASVLVLALALWESRRRFSALATGASLLLRARAAILGQFVLVTLAALSLIYVTVDFSIKYVAFNTTRATPIYHRFTGLWGAEVRSCSGSGFLLSSRP